MISFLIIIEVENKMKFLSKKKDENIYIMVKMCAGALKIIFKSIFI